MIRVTRSRTETSAWSWLVSWYRADNGPANRASRRDERHSSSLSFGLLADPPRARARIRRENLLEDLGPFRSMWHARLRRIFVPSSFVSSTNFHPEVYWKSNQASSILEDPTKFWNWQVSGCRRLSKFQMPVTSSINLASTFFLVFLLHGGVSWNSGRSIVRIPEMKAKLIFDSHTGKREI